MEELESQIAKIELGGGRHASSYVFTMAEKAAASNAELYLVCELPLLNPAAEDSCESICLAIASTLKRCYRRSIGEETFENAISQINEELGKLASMGQTHWIDKLNCIIAVKEGIGFTISSCGKVSAYLLRNEEFTDISCSSATQSHPLKTFENYASGKVRLGDLLILSTTQLFNHMSMDRLLGIVKDNPFLPATQTIIELLKKNGGPEVAFGTLLNLQVAPGETDNEEVDLENYVVENQALGNRFLDKAIKYVKTALTMDGFKRVPKVTMPKVSMESIKNIGGNARKLATKSKNAWNALGKGVTAGRNNFNPAKFKQLTPAKKFFFISALVLLLAFFINLSLAAHFKTRQQAQSQISTQLSDAENLLASAQSSLLYKDEVSAGDFIRQAQDKIPSEDKVPEANKEQYQKIKDKFTELQQKWEKNTVVNVTNLGSLSQSERLIQLTPYLATQFNSTIISYNTASGLVQDGQLLSSESIVESAFLKNATAVVYNGSSLLVWDFSKKQYSAPFSVSVPDKDSHAGLKLYPTNSRVYIINKKTNQILSFLVGTAISKPVVAVNGNDFGNSLDMAIDGGIYVLNTNGITKYLAGKLTDFKMPYLATPFSGSGRIFTDATAKNVYILDKGNKRILIIDKKGLLVATLTSPKFTDMKDFSVNEAEKIIYVLNDVSLFKISY